MRARLQPFSHLLGTQCLIPHTTWAVKAYPTRLVFTDLSLKRPVEHIIDFVIQGPIEDFTIQLDLEKECVAIFGKSFRTLIKGEKEGIALIFDRAICSEIVLFGKKRKIESKEKVLLPIKSSFYAAEHIERLTLGKHTKLDWQLVERRSELMEILPVWYRLAQLIPTKGKVPAMGITALLEKCHKEKSYARWKQLYDAGFESLMIPRLVDRDFQGLIESDEQGSALAVLAESFSLMRDMFYREKDDAIYLLPNLPREFHAGKLFGIQSDAEIDFEWSKKLLRNVVIRTGEKPWKKQLKLPKGIRRFRVRHSLNERGKMISTNKAIDLEPKRVIYLDRFQK